MFLLAVKKETYFRDIFKFEILFLVAAVLLTRFNCTKRCAAVGLCRSAAFPGNTFKPIPFDA
jgi:hypothetical protein